MDLSDYVGIPWLERGRDRAGIDCWGLMRLVYAERLGVDLPSFSAEYTTVADGEAIRGLVNGNMDPWREIAAGDERPGDGLLMAVAGRPHIGVVAGNGRVLHIERGAGAIIESYLGYRLKKWMRGVYRHASQ